MTEPLLTAADAQSPPQTPPATPTLAMLRTLGAIAMLSGLLVVLVYQFTKPIIAENQRVLTERAVFQVVPGAATKRDFVLSADGHLAPADAGQTGEPLYAAYDAAGTLVGVAFAGASRGYQDLIQILFGYDPNCECIVGSKVLKSTETPGLGDKIDTDPTFLANFEALDARLDDTGTALANPIVTVKQGTKRHPWEIDGISGATISCNALGRALDTAAGRFIPAVRRHLDLLTADALPEAGTTPLATPTEDSP